jgi:WXG100 family type VII secretion target
MIGGDLAQMQQLTSQLKQAGEQIRSLQSTVSNGILGTQWTGPAADRFRNAWNDQYKRNLDQLQTALNELADEVRKRRDALEAASA